MFSTLRPETRQRYALLPCLFNTALEAIASTTKQERERELDWKMRSKLFLFTDAILYVESHNESMKKEKKRLKLGCRIWDKNTKIKCILIYQQWTIKKEITKIIPFIVG